MNDPHFHMLCEVVKTQPAPMIAELVVKHLQNYLRAPDSKEGKAIFQSASLILAIKAGQITEPKEDFFSDVMLATQGYELLSKIKDKN